MRDEELKQAIREHAVLTGDFVLRSGQRAEYYIDKYRFATQPVMLEQLGTRLAEMVARVDPEAVRLAAPEIGAVPLAAAASMSSRLPFLIVRKEAKEYGTANRLEGVFAPGERVCLLEDVVTTGGAAVDAVHALREAGLECGAAVCIVDRESGGVDALARVAVRLHPLFKLTDVIEARKSPQNPHG
jgi:orotate phosphoribosyltransferase